MPVDALRRLMDLLDTEPERVTLCDYCQTILGSTLPSGSDHHRGLTLVYMSHLARDHRDVEEPQAKMWKAAWWLGLEGVPVGDGLGLWVAAQFKAMGAALFDVGSWTEAWKIMLIQPADAANEITIPDGVHRRG